MDEILSLKYFLEGHEQFSTGSRIIVTTRDVQLLRSVTDKIYEVKGLAYFEVLKLFHKHAFRRQISVAVDYEALSGRVITRANGNPFALKVLGSFLCSKSKQEWESALDKQAIDPDKEIIQALKISYDGLSKGSQNMFLDIACFITGKVYREEVEYMFSCSDHYDATIEITALIDKSLLTESCPYGRRRLSMHDLLREMGQAIVCDESKIPGNHSRLWTANDVCHVLEKNKGTDAIQGILLNLSDRGIKKNVQGTDAIQGILLNLSDRGTKKNVQLSYFRWDSCPLKYLPNFSPKNLVGLIMRENKLEKLWNEVQLLDLEKLKKIDLSNSEHLTGIPNLSGAINLETITLRGCKSLVQVALNLQNHPKLQILDLRGCDNLEECRDSENIATNNTTFIEEETSSLVPVELYFSDCKRLRSIPESIGKLKYLKWLALSECPNLEKFPEISSGGMECLDELLLGGTRIEELSESIENIKKLKHLSLKD
ncbi:disease resistance protein RUN1-like [Ziziphus jujuba]|uniref:Disease resistance protein RUN1-like n=1 Tax=Ziziphus jujuba TaxID=326968 RepID=A0ABM4AAY4_ZIZJJ|nr:disease resistance protein RUN1-like [Ziziphus jujuba]